MNDDWRRVGNPVTGETITFLRTSEETAGTEVVMLVSLTPGGSVKPHSHRMAETFECVEGTFRIHVDGRDATLSPGETMVAAPGVMHGFSNDTDKPATVRVTATPARDIDKILRTLAGLARDGRLRPGRPPQDPLLMASLAYRGRYYAPPLPRWLYWPLIGGLAALGRRAADQAIDRYSEMPLEQQFPPDPEELRTRARRIIEEVVNQGDLAVADELFSVDCVHHVLGAQPPRGAPPVREEVARLRRAFPDLHAIIEDEIVEGDRVVQRITGHGTHEFEYRGVVPTGERITFRAIGITRVGPDGRFAEQWSTADLLTVLQRATGPAATSHDGRNHP